MARPKAAFLQDLAAQAKVDLDIHDNKGVARKLHAIIAVAKHPLETVAEILGTTTQSLCLWVKAYKKEGIKGLWPKPKKAKRSKLSPEQKILALQWVDEAKTPQGKDAHWTLEKLRQALTEEFGVTLGINTIWVWLRKEGRKLKVPRPRHYQADEQAQQEFKKN